MTPQEEGAAGVKTRKKAKSKNMSASVRQGSRQWQNLRIFMLTEVWSGSCQMIHAHWPPFSFSFSFFFATSGFSFSCYWEQFYIVYVHVCMGIIRMWLESRLSSWPSGLWSWFIHCTAAQTSGNNIIETAKTNMEKKICLAHKPNWIS